MGDGVDENAEEVVELEGDFYGGEDGEEGFGGGGENARRGGDGVDCYGGGGEEFGAGGGV